MADKHAMEHEGASQEDIKKEQKASQKRKADAFAGKKPEKPKED